jgi:hypothetical protein
MVEGKGSATKILKGIVLRRRWERMKTGNNKKYCDPRTLSYMRTCVNRSIDLVPGIDPKCHVHYPRLHFSHESSVRLTFAHHDTNRKKNSTMLIVVAVVNAYHLVGGTYRLDNCFAINHLSIKYSTKNRVAVVSMAPKFQKGPDLKRFMVSVSFLATL